MLIAAIITTIIIKIASSTNSVLYPKAKVTGNATINNQKTAKKQLENLLNESHDIDKI